MIRKLPGFRGNSGILPAVAVLIVVSLVRPLPAEDAIQLYGPHGVEPQTVRQGLLGSCYFHASIAALAQAAPERLRGAIRENPGGGYKVRFFDGPEEVVLAEDVEFGRGHSYDRSEGTWVAVLMRAYGQRALRQTLVAAIQKSDSIPMFTKPLALSFLDQSNLPLVAYDRAVRSVVQQDGVIDKAALKAKLTAQLTYLGVPAAGVQILSGFLDEQGFFDSVARTVEQNGDVFGAYKSLNQGGVPTRVFEAFLGRGDAGMVADKKLTIGQLQRLKAGGMAMVAGTWETAPDDTIAKSNWWVPEHSYTVLSFDEAAQTVTLRNPWGAKPDPDGVFTLPFAVFVDAFQTYTYSQSPTQ